MNSKHILALGVLFASATAAALLARAEKAAPQPTEQQKLKERVDALESQLKEAQAKADKLDSNIKAAAIEKDYVERIQKEVNAYYEKAFNTQLATVTIIALIVGLIGKFGVDHIVQSKLTEASAKLREDFTTQLAVELEKLKDSNAAQLKQLEEDLNQRVEKRAAKLENEAGAVILLSTAVSLTAAQKYNEARDSARYALGTLAKNPEGFPQKTGQVIVTTLFRAIKAADPQNFTDKAKKELAAHPDLYKKFENELNAAAVDIPDFAQVLKEARVASPNTPKS